MLLHDVLEGVGQEPRPIRHAGRFTGTSARQPGARRTTHRSSQRSALRVKTAAETQTNGAMTQTEHCRPVHGRLYAGWGVTGAPRGNQGKGVRNTEYGELRVCPCPPCHSDDMYDVFT
eukprot:11332237-Alexandrium_andersonii.AAC.1